MPVVAGPLDLVPRCPGDQLNRRRRRILRQPAPLPGERAALVPAERKAHHVAPLPADKLSRPREKVSMVPHEVVRDDHCVHIVAGHLSRTEQGGATKS